MTPSRTRLAALATAGALTTGATVAALSPAIAPAVAQEASEEVTPAPERSERGERLAQRRAEFAAALAEELGLETEQVQAALDAVKERFTAEARDRHLERLRERLDAAVSDGRLTREQADAVLAAAESGALPGPHRARHRGPGRFHTAPPPPSA